MYYDVFSKRWMVVEGTKYLERMKHLKKREEKTLLEYEKIKLKIVQGQLVYSLPSLFDADDDENVMMDDDISSDSEESNNVTEVTNGENKRKNEYNYLSTEERPEKRRRTMRIESIILNQIHSSYYSAPQEQEFDMNDEKKDDMNGEFDYPDEDEGEDEDEMVDDDN